MSPEQSGELICEVTQEAEGEYSAECLSENISAQGDREATSAFFFDSAKP
jgi:hypothetical protein